jgi:VanZ family protein
MANGGGFGKVGNLIGGRRWLPAVVWGIVIMVVSSLPRLDLGPRWFPGCDKVVHFIEYLILGAALRYWSGEGRFAFPAAGAGFAALDEFHQRYIPGRETSLWDFIADICGLIVGFVAAGRLEKRNGDG